MDQHFPSVSFDLGFDSSKDEAQQPVVAQPGGDLGLQSTGTSNGMRCAPVTAVDLNNLEKSKNENQMGSDFLLGMVGYLGYEC